MRESDRRHIVRGLGSLALAGFLAVGFQLVSPLQRSQAATPEHAHSPLSGPARIIDGDTIAIGDARIRLEGIDAPELGQTCQRPELDVWDCGAAAARELSELIEGRHVQCESTGNDKYGRMLGICHVGPLELNAELVRRGLAWAFVRYSRRLVSVEAEARALKRGVWQTHNEPPWAYRASRWSYSESAAPRGCAIKGNVSRGGRIYHVPWSPLYDNVHIDSSRGERWFCSEAEAIAAGWRPALTN